MIKVLRKFFCGLILGHTWYKQRAYYFGDFHITEYACGGCTKRKTVWNDRAIVEAIDRKATP